MMFSYDGSYGWLGMLFMIFWWIFLIIILALCVKWLVIVAGSRRREEKSALEILKERYAKGEIDKKEFEERSKTIKDS